MEESLSESKASGVESNVGGSEDILVAIVVEGVVGVGGAGHVASGGGGICGSIVCQHIHMYRSVPYDGHTKLCVSYKEPAQKLGIKVMTVMTAAL